MSEDLKLARQAAIYKSRGGISYGDAYAAALTKERKADHITGDTKFKKLEKKLKSIGLFSWLNNFEFWSY